MGSDRQWRRGSGWSIARCALVAALAPGLGLAAGDWSSTGSMGVPREYHTATLLADGRVLVAGGDGSLTSCELFDPATGTFAPTGVMSVGRQFHTATLLLDGRVLMAGGSTIPTTELYDPATGGFSVTGALAQARYWATATRLPSGKVLAAGGLSGSTALSSSELYDPATGLWTPTGSLQFPRYEHAAELLGSGEVLVANGSPDGMWPVAESELYDVATGTWALDATSTNPGVGARMTLLDTGEVMLAGGYIFIQGGSNQVEIYDPVAHLWRPVDGLFEGRGSHTITLLQDGRPMAVGGDPRAWATATTEQYDAATDAWLQTADMNAPRLWHTATLLLDGRLLATGGWDAGNVLATAEIYTPCTTVPVVSPASLPDGHVQVPYDQTLTASGGTSPYTFVLAKGVLPPNLSLDAAGRIRGNPRQTGTWSFVVGVADAERCVGSRAYTLTIGECFVVLGPGSLPSGTVGASYAAAVQASGGTAPYGYAVTAGVLPPGLQLDAASGAITGVPTTAGSYPFTITATDAVGCPASVDYAVAISCLPITLDPPTLPDGNAALPYAASLAASGGSAPYLYDLASGALPPGLALDPGTGAITGTCPVPGTWSFTARATDVYGCAGSRTYDIAMSVAGDLLAGEAASDTRVRILDAAGGAAVTFRAYAGGAGTRVAAGDLDLDGFDEVITGVGSGGPHVRAFRRDGTPVAKVSFYAYGTLTGGVKVAAGSLDLDAHAELATGPGPSEVFGPHVRGWNYDATPVTPIGKVSFYAYQTLKYGVNVASSDLDGDPFRELATAPGPGMVFGPQVKGWNVDGGAVTPLPGMNFFAFTTSYGAEVAAAEAAGGEATIGAAQGPGPANAAEVAGFRYTGSGIAALPGYRATPFPTRFGARVGLGELGGTPGEELACGAGPDPAADATLAAYAYDGAGLVPLAGFPVLAFTSTGGVNVGAGLTGH